MADIETEHVLAGFVAAVRPVAPVLAVWAHGSPAMGDFQPGRSDLDLVAVIGAPLDGEQRDRLESIRRRLSADEPAAAKLHCSYMVAAALPRPGPWRRVRRGLRARAFIRREIERILGSVRTGPPGLSSE